MCVKPTGAFINHQQEGATIKWGGGRRIQTPSDKGVIKSRPPLIGGPWGVIESRPPDGGGHRILGAHPWSIM